MSDRDASLLARVVKDDDRAAFELLVRRYQSPLRHFLRRLTHQNAECADDLAQETFLQVFMSIETYQGAAKFSTWLYRIAYSTFLNDQRKEIQGSEFDEMRHSPRHDASETVAGESDVDLALRRLSVRQRAVFDLHYTQGLTHQEVASALELPLGTIKSDLTRGRTQLKAILMDWEQA